MLAQDLMTPDPVTLGPDDTVLDAPATPTVGLETQRGFGTLPDDKRTDGDADDEGGEAS